MSASGTAVAHRVAKLRLPIIRTTVRQSAASRVLADSLAELDTIDGVLRDNEVALDPPGGFEPSFDADQRVFGTCDSIQRVPRLDRGYSYERGGDKAR